MPVMYPKFSIKSFIDLYQVKIALRIKILVTDGITSIGYIAIRLIEAYEVTKEVLKS